MSLVRTVLPARHCQTRKRQQRVPSVWQVHRGGEGSGLAEAAAVVAAHTAGRAAKLGRTQRRLQTGPTVLRTRLTMREMRVAAPSARSVSRYGASAVQMFRPACACLRAVNARRRVSS